MFSSAKEVLEKYNGSASKRFGQNYIFSKNINQKIVNFAGNLENKTVLEIGPGPGGLTLEILAKNPKKFIIVELDKLWSEAWSDITKDDKHVAVISSDILHVDITELKPDIIISNLPYNISSQVLFKVLPKIHIFEKIVFMFQKELADRICADFGNKTYGKLSVLSQWKSIVRKELALPPGAFTPAPKVHSAVLSFSPKSQDSIDFNRFNHLLTVAFSNRRKQVLKLINKEFNFDCSRIFEQIGIKNTARAEEISVQNFIQIMQYISNMN